MAKQEETPAQGKAGQIAGFRDRKRNRRPAAAPLNFTRPTEVEIDQGNTPSPSPTGEIGRGSVKQRRPRSDDGDVPLFAVPGAGGKVVAGGIGDFGIFGAGVSAFGGAKVLGEVEEEREEKLERPGLTLPEVRSGGQRASSGIQVKGAAADRFAGAGGGGLGFGGVEASPRNSEGGGFLAGVRLPLSGWGEAKPVTATASSRQTAGIPPAPLPSVFIQPDQSQQSQRNLAKGSALNAGLPSVASDPRFGGLGQHNPLSSFRTTVRPNSLLFAPPAAGGGASTGNYTDSQGQFGGEYQRGDDDDIEVLDAGPELHEDFDILCDNPEPEIEELPPPAAKSQVTEWTSALSQKPTPTTLLPQHSIFKEFNKQKELDLKEAARQKLIARLKTVGVPTKVPSMPSQLSGGTPILGQFLVAINGFIKADNEAQITDFMVIEPPYSDMYNRLISELQQHFPKGSENALEEKCRQALSAARDGVNGSPSWSQCKRLMAQYLGFLRDVDMDQSKYLQTYELLTELQRKANSALTHAQLGHLVLGTVISCAKAVSRLAIGLDKQPHLIAHLRSAQLGEGGDENEARTLPERAVEIIRLALTNCLTDRSSRVEKDGRITGKQRGTYTIANICLKIFFQCRKTRNAMLIFQSIGSTTVPLSAYAKRERTTYLYYLGRFWFQNNHFQRARLALQQSYDECSAHDHSIRQRRYILVFLIASNLIVGRFPSHAIFQRPEAQGLQERFLPLMQAIRSGNIALFRQHMSLESPHADWFLHFRILLQLKNRCEVLVWRSLVRRIWILNGTRFDPGNPRTAVTIDMNDLVAAFSALEKQSRLPEDESYLDPDLDGAEDHVEEERLPDVRQIESILASLVSQGLIKGFIAHRQHKFSIMGVRNAGGNALAAGFPPPSRVIEQRISEEEGHQEIPGWKTGAPGSMTTGGGMGGSVVTMKNLRQVGSA